jgi:hypothetical protein
METNFVIVLIFVHDKKQKAMQNLHANVLLNLPFVPFFFDDPGYRCAEMVMTIPLPFLLLFPQGRSGLALGLSRHFPFFRAQS